MISVKSRYATNAVSLVNDTRGSVLTILPRDPKPVVANFTYVYLQDGDRLDLMAHRLFGDPGQWWRIADVNPEILDWANIPVGTVLRIPSNG